MYACRAQPAWLGPDSSASAPAGAQGAAYSGAQGYPGSGVLAEVAHDAFTLLAERPPRALPAAQRLAAEQFAFADECSAAGQEGMNEFSIIAPRLVNTPAWGFCWD